MTFEEKIDIILKRVDEIYDTFPSDGYWLNKVPAEVVIKLCKELNITKLSEKIQVAAEMVGKDRGWYFCGKCKHYGRTGYYYVDDDHIPHFLGTWFIRENYLKEVK